VSAEERAPGHRRCSSPGRASNTETGGAMTVDLIRNAALLGRLLDAALPGLPRL